MKITFIFIGKTRISYVNEGISDYLYRLKHYVKAEIKIIPDLKNTKSMSEDVQLYKEGEATLKELPEGSVILLMDEKGKQFSSLDFAGFLEKKMIEGRNLCLVIGGAYGFSNEMLLRADMKISLSNMTFSHQMVRMILLEQVYRAFTILKGEPYHHS